MLVRTMYARTYESVRAYAVEPLCCIMQHRSCIPHVPAAHMAHVVAVLRGPDNFRSKSKVKHESPPGESLRHEMHLLEGELVNLQQ